MFAPLKYTTNDSGSRRRATRQPYTPWEEHELVILHEIVDDNPEGPVNTLLSLLAERGINRFTDIQVKSAISRYRHKSKKIRTASSMSRSELLSSGSISSAQSPLSVSARRRTRRVLLDSRPITRKDGKKAQRSNTVTSQSEEHLSDNKRLRIQRLLKGDLSAVDMDSLETDISEEGESVEFDSSAYSINDIDLLEEYLNSAARVATAYSRLPSADTSKSAGTADANVNANIGAAAIAQQSSPAETFTNYSEFDLTNYCPITNFDGKVVGYLTEDKNTNQEKKAFQLFDSAFSCIGYVR